MTGLKGATNWWAAVLAAFCLALAAFFFIGPGARAADGPGAAAHLGVASCAGSTCHGRSHYYVFLPAITVKQQLERGQQRYEHCRSLCPAQLSQRFCQ